jgi:hypothetical protein
MRHSSYPLEPCGARGRTMPEKITEIVEFAMAADFWNLTVFNVHYLKNKKPIKAQQIPIR